MGLDDVTTKDFVGTHAAIVGALGSGEAVLRPAERVHVIVEQGVLLLDTKPGLMFGRQLHSFEARPAVVRLSRLLVVLVRLAEDESVVAQVERIPVDGHGVEIDIGIASFRLVCGAAVIVPNWQFCT